MQAVTLLILLVSFVGFSSCQTNERIASQLFNGARCNPCQQIDVVWIVENSANVQSAANFLSLKRFVTNFSNLWVNGSLGGSLPRFGLVTFVGAQQATVNVPLISNLTEFTRQVNLVNYNGGGGTNTTDALYKAQSLLLTTPPNVTRVIIFVLFSHNEAGSDQDLAPTLRAVRLLRQQGTYVSLVPIGFGPFFANFPSRTQFAKIGGYYGYDWTTNLQFNYSLDSNTTLTRNLFTSLCPMKPINRLIRPQCPLASGDFSGNLKHFPPGRYSLGTITPVNYTTRGYLNIPTYTNNLANVTFNFFPSLNWTIEFWVWLYNSPRGVNQTFISQSGNDLSSNGNALFFVGLDDGRVRFFLGNGNLSAPYINLTSTDRLQPRKWYHIAVNVEQLSYDSSPIGDATDEKYASVYVNGFTWTSGVFTARTLNVSSNPIQIGRYNSPNGRLGCNCFFDEIRFWNGCQSKFSLGSRANLVLNGYEPNLLGYWNFEDTTTWNFPDVTPRNNTAIQRGASPWITQVAEMDNLCVISHVPTIRPFETVCNQEP